MEDFVLDILLQGLPYLDFGEAILHISRDYRHGQRGFRVVKTDYYPKRGHIWDEQYQFYTNLNDLFTAIETGDFSQGVKDF